MASGVLAAAVALFYFEALLPVALLVGILAGITFFGPRWLFLTWLLATCAIPAWAGAANEAFWEAGTLIALLVSPGLLFHLSNTKIELNAGDALVAGFALTALLSASVGETPTGQVASLVFVGLMPYTLIRFLAVDRLGVDWILRVFAVLMGIFALLALIEVATDYHPLSGTFGNSPTSFWSDIQYRSGVSRSEVTFGHSLALGGCLAMAIPFALGSSFDRRIKLGLVVLLVIGVASTQSRSAMIAALLGIALTLLARRFGDRRARLLILGSTVAVLIAAASFFLIFYSDRESIDSVIHRSNLYTDLFPDFNPIGLADNFTISGGTATLDGEETSVDSSLLQAGLLYGWAAIAIMVAGLLIPLYRLFVGRATVPDITLAAQLPVILTVWLITQYYPILWMLIGLVVAAVPNPRWSWRFRLLPRREASEHTQPTSSPV